VQAKYDGLDQHAEERDDRIAGECKPLLPGKAPSSLPQYQNVDHHDQQRRRHLHPEPGTSGITVLIIHAKKDSRELIANQEANINKPEQER